MLRGSALCRCRSGAECEVEAEAGDVGAARHDRRLLGCVEVGPLQFEAASAQLDEEGKQLVRALIEGVLLRHEARRWANAG